MKILIVDDAAVWLKQGRTLLEAAGYDVRTIHVTDPEAFVADGITPELRQALQQADALLCDKDLGKADSTALLCQVRADFPQLPIVRWTGGYDRSDTLQLLGVTSTDKPSKNREATWVEQTFAAALETQRLILGGPLVILAKLRAETPTTERERDDSSRRMRLRQLSQIVELDTLDRTPVLDEYGVQEYDSYRGRSRSWQLTGEESGVMKHEFGHAVCDGVLSADDIRPLLPRLQAVVARLEAAGNVDSRFRTCADFIAAGNLDELELVRGCY